MESLKTAQELIKTNDPNVMGGFNQFVYGTGKPEHSQYGDKTQWGKEIQGYEFAEKMAKENGISFTHVFKCGRSDRCFPFSYGGFFVCNTCGLKSVDKEWWKIKVDKDGGQFCCHGLDLINLQESENYAYGETFEQAISNYEIVMLKTTYE